MNRISLAVLAAALALPMAAGAAEFRKGDLVVQDPWARATVARTGAAYMVVANTGTTADRLVKASAGVSEITEIHTHLIEDGVMKMRRIDGVDVDPGATAVFAPGGLHIMLIKLKAPLTEGATFPLTLTFEKAGTMEVEATVAGVGAMGPAGAMGTMRHGH